MDIKMIAMDLDSTLMRTDKTISDYTVKTLLRCQSQGTLLAFATARSAAASGRARSLINPEIMVTCGGALAQYGDKTIYSSVLAPETANRIVGYCKELSSVGHMTAETETGSLTSYPGKGDYANAVLHDFSSPFLRGVYKLVIQISSEAERLRLIDEFPFVNVQSYVGTNWCFIANAAATKWAALKAVADSLFIEPRAIAAFGDDAGDLEMITESGVGVAMGNAIASVAAAADAVCASCDEDGLAHWVSENILG